MAPNCTGPASEEREALTSRAAATHTGLNAVLPVTRGLTQGPQPSSSYTRLNSDSDARRPGSAVGPGPAPGPGGLGPSYAAQQALATGGHSSLIKINETQNSKSLSHTSRLSRAQEPHVSWSLPSLPARTADHPASHPRKLPAGWSGRLPPSPRLRPPLGCQSQATARHSSLGQKQSIET